MVTPQSKAFLSALHLGWEQLDSLFRSAEVIGDAMKLLLIWTTSLDCIVIQMSSLLGGCSMLLASV